MAGFAFALAVDANEIQVEMHIELCYSLSRYREYLLTTQGRTQDFGRGVSCSSKRYRALCARRNFAKPHPLISEKYPWMEAI